ncbi:putative mitochondrial protein, conserved [Pestalotiopsis sp. 9143b]|nr:putative mitochondrial protein, conserved [Pestalotiopsis sp. 9143b]
MPRLPSLARRLARPSSSILPRHILLAPSTTPRATYATGPFAHSPAPPRLPAEEQAEFERLQRAANTQESLDPADHDAPPAAEAQQINPSPVVESPVAKEALSNSATLGEVSNLPLRKGAPPEFEGEINPKTGEVGGPKNEPLRWGSAGDWSYNGRVTDF